MLFKSHFTVELQLLPHISLHLVAKSNVLSKSKTVNLYWENFRKLFPCYFVFTTTEFCVWELTYVTANRKVIPESSKEDEEEVKALN